MINIVGSLLGVEVLLCDEVVFIERLCALIVEFLLLEVGLGLFYVGFSRLLRRCRNQRWCARRRCAHRLLGGNRRGGLLAFNGREQLALGHVVALFTIEVRDALQRRWHRRSQWSSA